MTDIKTTIKNEIENNDVVLFMKGTASSPMCGFSFKVVKILKDFGVKFKDVNVLESEELRQGIKDYTNWPTVPQLYVKSEFIGGSDIVLEMLASGELQDMFKQKLGI